MVRLRRSWMGRAALCLGLTLPAVAHASPLWVAPSTTLVSLAEDGRVGNGFSGEPAISDDGRYVAFHSDAANLVADDNNATIDVFVRDLRVGQTRRVSVASDGSQGNDLSWQPAVSGNGRYVAFQSYASNLVDDDTNGIADVFVHDVRTGETQRVSVASDGSQANDFASRPALSRSGRYVAFESAASNLVADDQGAGGIFVHDLRTGLTRRVSVAGSSHPALSGDGRYVAFASVASNLVAGDTNGTEDVFVRDLRTDRIRRVSVASDGSQADAGGFGYGADVSNRGRYVAFDSAASNLVAADTNGTSDVFVHDVRNGETQRVSVATDGTEGNGHSYNPALSDNGRYVAFASQAFNLVPGDTPGAEPGRHFLLGIDIFVRDLRSDRISRVNVATDGTPANADSYDPAISARGTHVAFSSWASNLAPNDTNNLSDVFIARGRSGQR